MEVGAYGYCSITQLVQKIQAVIMQFPKLDKLSFDSVYDTYCYFLMVTFRLNKPLFG